MDPNSLVPVTSDEEKSVRRKETYAPQPSQVRAPDVPETKFSQKDIEGYDADGNPIYRPNVKIGSKEIDRQGGRYNAQGIPVDKDGNEMSPWQIIGSHFRDTGLTWADTATFGAARPVAGLRGALQSLMDPDQTWSEGYQESRNEADEYLAEARDNIDPVSRTAADTLGIFGGGAKVADDVIEFMWGKFAPSAGEKMLKYGATFASGSGTAFMENYFKHGMEFDEAILQSAADGIAGVGMQKVMGDVILGNAAKLWNSITGGNTSYPADVMSDMIMTDVKEGKEGLTLEGLWALSKQIEANQGFFDIEDFRGDPQSEAMRKFYNSLAKHVFKDADAVNRRSGSNAALIDRYTALNEEMKRVFKKSNDQYEAVIDTQLGGWEDEYNNLLKNYDLEETKAINDSLLATEALPDGSLPLGAQTADAKGIVDRVTDKWLKQTDVTKLPEGGPEATKVRREFEHLLREQVELRGGNYRRKALGEDDDTPIEDIYGQITVAELIRARRTLADKVQPTYRTDKGGTVTKTESKYYYDYMKLLDEEIDGLVEGAYGKTRQAYSNNMRIQEAHEIGQQYHAQRSFTADDPEKFAAYYNKNLKEIKESMSPDEWAAFQAGYKKDMKNKLHERSADYQLKLQLGDVSDNKAYSRKQSGYEDYELVLGKPGADEFVKLATEQKTRIDVGAKMAELVGLKKGSKEAQEFIGAANEWAKYGGSAKVAGANASQIDLLYGLRAFAKSPSEQARIEKMIKLATLRGPALARFLKKSVRAAAGLPVQLGVQASAAQPMDITQYLESVAAEGQNGNEGPFREELEGQ